ncbi:saccharopine dehydrogenase NADP-binding domain-containing protein [Nonomuraea sp. CA-141351]|uniref:saccharopine dehydrogenase NADP-binding domain-containing protein n=1 Tax=Nonomuraea sp. CA-141351 TaxID=3239996 RepID=UPI003D950A37
MKLAGDGLLVAGGYGAVGVIVSRTLADLFPGRVVPAGRDLTRARGVAAETGSAGAARVDVAGDVGEFEDVLARHRIGVVVLCVEPPDDRIARACLTRGVHLVDVGASHHLLAQVELLHGPAAAAGVRVALSVGVAPGMTNLLARRAHHAVGGADRVDLTVLLGAGERHGADAVRWTIARLADPAARARPARVPLPGHRIRTAHPFPFSDQYSLRRTLGVPDVTTRLCLDSRALTAALFGLRRVGAFRTARHPGVRRALTAALTRVHLGGDGWAVRADARVGDAHAAYALTGKAQSRATALVAAQVTRRLIAGAIPAGVHHIDELPALASLPEDLSEHGVHLWTPDILDTERP